MGTRCFSYRDVWGNTFGYLSIHSVLTGLLLRDASSQLRCPTTSYHAQRQLIYLELSLPIFSSVVWKVKPIPSLSRQCGGIIRQSKQTVTGIRPRKQSSVFISLPCIFLLDTVDRPLLSIKSNIQRLIENPRLAQFLQRLLPICAFLA